MTQAKKEEDQSKEIWRACGAQCARSKEFQSEYLQPGPRTRTVSKNQEKIDSRSLTEKDSVFAIILPRAAFYTLRCHPQRGSRVAGATSFAVSSLLLTPTIQATAPRPPCRAAAAKMTVSEQHRVLGR